MPQLRRRARERRRSRTRLDCLAAAARARAGAALRRRLAAPILDGSTRPVPTSGRRRAAATIGRMRDAVAFTVFATAIGDCALAWNDGRPARVLAARGFGRRACAARIAQALPAAVETAAAPEQRVAAVVAAITALLRGERTRPAPRSASTTRGSIAVRPPRLCRRADDRARPGRQLRRSRRPGRRRRHGARRRPVARPQSVPDRRPLPSDRRRRRRARRLLGAGRHGDQAAPADDRGRAPRRRRPTCSTRSGARGARLASAAAQVASRRHRRHAFLVADADRGVGPLVGADQAAARQAVLADRLEHRLAPRLAVEARAAPRGRTPGRRSDARRGPGGGSGGSQLACR